MMDSGEAEAPLRVERLEDGRIWHCTLNAPKGNVLDATMVAALTGTFDRVADDQSVRAVVLDGEGRHFSFGASVEEHLPGRVAGMLAGFHGMFLKALDAGVPLLAAVRGQCLGGGLELAAFANRLIASPDARLGQPEIVLGVFAPVASLVLPGRIGRGHAEDLLLSGRVVGAEEARVMGLVDEIAEDPSSAAIAWAREHLLPRSGSSLRHATRAARRAFAEAFRKEVAGLERLYLDELMKTRDAEEGLLAFLEKRQPVWNDA